TVVSTHRRRPLPQRPGHHRGDVGGEMLGDHDNVIAGSTSTQRGGQTHHTGADNQNLRPFTFERYALHVLYPFGWVAAIAAYLGRSGGHATEGRVATPSTVSFGCQRPRAARPPLVDAVGRVALRKVGRFIGCRSASRLAGPAPDQNRSATV